MNKRIVLVLGILFIFVLSACGNKVENEPKDEEVKSEEVVEVKEEEEEAEEVEEVNNEEETIEAEDELDEEDNDNHRQNDTIDEDEYLEKIHDYSVELLFYMEDFLYLSYDANDDPNLFYDETWLEFTNSSLNSMQDVINDIKAVSVPVRFEYSYDIMLEAIDEFEYAINTYPSAIEFMDANLANSSVNAVLKGEEYLVESAETHK